MSGKIYSYPNNWRVSRILAVASLVDFKIEQPEFDMSTAKSAEFLEKFPFGCVPAFETSDGLYLAETPAIATYVAFNGAKKLPNLNKEDQALEVQWVSIVDQEIMARYQLISGMMSYIPYNKPTYQWVINKIMERLEAINKVLQSQTFLVGERISIADITLAAAMSSAFAGHIDASLRAKIPNVVRLTETVIHAPQFAGIFPSEIKYSETAPQYQPANKKDAGAAKPKEAKAAAAATPAAPKAPKAKKAVEKDDDDEEDDLVPAEPKAKNPLDDLPKSDFKLDDWKRTYSNEDTRASAIPWFYKNFDAEGFSVWKVEFKYNDELTQVFMSSNLIGGFFNRLEASRKYAFGNLAVYGKANDSVISGAFVIRGKDFKPVMDVAPDWESYEYTPLDLSKSEDKEFFEATLAWDGEVASKAFADAKTFK